uniref:Endonuclease/exonuclease/phosphatase domain-containing protein n=1 Tax=Oryza brachyantha TaxID=4533 RepID=J3LW48_ORYBR
MSPDAAAAAMAAALHIPACRFTVHLAQPDHFVFVFSSSGDMDLALARSPIPAASRQLVLRPWSRVASASAFSLLFRVSLDHVGVPAHASNPSTAAALIAPCRLLALDMAAGAGRPVDYRRLGLSALAPDPALIPRERLLLIPEPSAHGDGAPPLLQYNVVIHVRATSQVARGPEADSPQLLAQQELQLSAAFASHRPFSSGTRLSSAPPPPELFFDELDALAAEEDVAPVAVAGDNDHLSSPGGSGSAESGTLLDVPVMAIDVEGRPSSVVLPSAAECAALRVFLARCCKPLPPALLSAPPPPRPLAPVPDVSCIYYQWVNGYGDHKNVFIPAYPSGEGICLITYPQVWCCADVVPWWLSVVYGPQEEPHKLRFLDELRTLRSSLAGPWVVAGDFNLILEARDKSNSNLNRRMMGRFRRLTDELDLRKLPLWGRRFTWSNERAMPTLVKLDRVFFSQEWDELFPSCLLQAASSVASDHCALLLHSCLLSPKAHRFCFEAFWPSLDGFLQVVQDAWRPPVHLHPLAALAWCLSSTATRLQRWSDCHVGSVRLQLIVTPRNSSHEFLNLIVY